MLGIIDDRFALQTRLGRSELTTVYLAQDRASGQTVVVRELARQFFNDPDLFSFFLTEWDQVGRGRHPALLEAYSVKRAGDGRVFLVGEYHPGVSLRTFIDFLSAAGRVCPPAVTAHITGEVATGLQHAHQMINTSTGEPDPMLHLDLCPANILLTTKGVIKLKGLEISRAYLRRGKGERPGRLAYFAPEKVAGAYLDTRSDLFSLAACTFEMLTGALPFPGATPTEIKRRITAGEGDFSLLDQSGIPRGVSAILQRALHTEPENRYPDLAEFQAALGSVAARRKAADTPRELISLLTTYVDPEEFAIPPEEITEQLEKIKTETLRDLPSATVAKPSRPQQPRPTPPPPTPVEPVEKMEPIEALARGRGIAPPPPPPPPLPPPRSAAPLRPSRSTTSRSSPPRWGWWLAGVVVLFLMMDFVFGLTPLGRLAHAPSSVRQAEKPINSIPNGASIYLNGSYAGRTPFTVSNWPEGVVAVRLEYGNLDPAETTVVVEKGESPALPLFILTRRLAIRARPPGGAVLINGRQISGAAAAGFSLGANDTISIEIRRAGLSSPPPLLYSVAGPAGDSLTERWTIEERSGAHPTTITGIFSREIMITSQPPGAAVFVDDDSLARGNTKLVIDLPLGAHQLLLRLPAFLNYSFAVEITEDSPDRYAPILSRIVHISARGAVGDADDLGADIRWMRRRGQLLIKEDDHRQTPYSLSLEAVEHEFILSKKGYRDTIVTLPAGTDAITVVLTPDEGRRPPEPDEPAAYRWVQFSVRWSGRPVSGAVVVGIDQEFGERMEIGVTAEEGDLLVKVPLGKYRFLAIKDNEESRDRKITIKPDKRTKKIALKFR